MGVQSLEKFHSVGTENFRKRSTKMELKSLTRFHSNRTKKFKKVP